MPKQLRRIRRTRRSRNTSRKQHYFPQYKTATAVAATAAAAAVVAHMNFNQLTAAAAAAAAGNPSNINMSSFTTAVSNILANSNIDLSQLASLSQLGTGALSAAAVQPPTSRQNLQQAHHHRGSNSANSSLNSNSHLPSSLSNLERAETAAVASINSVAGLPASITNLTSSALADLAASAHQPVAHSARTSIQSAHHRSSSASNHHHHNHHSAQLTAAHQSTSSSKTLAAHHHQSQSTIHHRHSTSSHNSSTTLSNHNNINHNNNLNNISYNNNINNINNNSSSQTIIATNNSNSITPPKSSTCYRIGDCIYFETSPTMPLQIGRLDEICKTNGDIIEVKIVVFFRRRDIPSSLMTLADKYQYDESQEEEMKQMSEKDKHLLKQRELFYSRQIETIPASSIRGKCTVQLLNESESFASYINKEDYYFYSLVYDPQQKTIAADRGEIRVGQRYQAEVQPNSVYTFQPNGDQADPRDLSEMETLVYTPDHNLTDDEINKFLTIAKSVGTFARALDCSSSIKQPSLHLTAASASRDVTILYAMQLLHRHNYNLSEAVCALVPSTGPILCRDEIEEWTAGEATLFEEAIEKYGREFGEIRQDFVSTTIDIYSYSSSYLLMCFVFLKIHTTSLR